MVERNAGQTGNRGSVNIRRSVRREIQHSIGMNGIAKDRVKGRVRTDQGGGHDEGHNRMEDRPMGRAGQRAWQ